MVIIKKNRERETKRKERGGKVQRRKEKKKERLPRCRETEPLYTAGGNAKYCNCYRKRL